MTKENVLMIIPNNEKMKLLSNLEKDNSLHNIKFMTKEEFLSNYYFKSDEKTLFYLLNKYKLNLDVAKVYLKNLYVIDINKEYSSSKLNFLKNLKIELKENNLLEENPFFKDYIKDKKIVVKNYYDLDKYEEELFNHKVEIPKYELNIKVVENSTMEEEVNDVCLNIINLLKQGISLNNIYLTNISSDYHYTLKKIFNYYNIPININFSYSIYGTKVVNDYLKTKEIDLENKDNLVINRKLVNIISSLSSIDDKTPEYETLLIDKLKSTKLPNKKLKDAVNIKDFYKETFTDEDYVFVLGFNQDSLPKLEKDIDYINDDIKDEVSMYKTTYLNKRNKELVGYLLSNIKNLHLSYKLSSPFSSFYKSALINDFNLEVIKPLEDNFTSSNIYNELRLGESLDLYNLYGEKTNSLEKLLTHYNIPYKTYSNAYTGISNDLYLTNLPYPLKLSYTSLNAYSECKFKYYLKYVLKLEPFEETFPSFIGTMYHEILRLYKKTNFDFETEYQNYISKHELTLKEKMLLVKIKRDLKDFLEVLKKQDLITGYNDAYMEKKIDIPLDKKVEVIFTGIIDKIMYYQKIEDTYFSIVDYKSGYIDTHIEPMKYGLHMQLPVYLYLIHYSKAIPNPIFTGIYYQNILFNYPTYSKSLEKEINERTFLHGYSTDDTSILERFDPTYEKSEFIKSLSYKEEKGFGTYSKIMDNNTLYELVKYTKNHIDKTTDDILNSDFEINPKVYDKQNISCSFCPFNDICYTKEKDLTYLEKVEDLSFLGGDE